MGFSLKKSFKKLTKSVLKRAPLIAGAAFGVPGALPALGQSVQSSLLRVRQPAPGPLTGFVGGGPSYYPALGSIQLGDPMIQGEGAVIPAMGGVPAVIGGLSTAVIRAITSLGMVLGIRVTALNITRVGMRAWRVVTGFARRHPGLSVITFLTSLGLAAEEAVEFLTWGESKARRRRRRRGISAADMRVTRRTMRRMIRFHSDLRAIAGPGARRGGRRVAGAITAVSAGG